MAEPFRCSRRWRTPALLAALSVALAACQTTPTAPPTLDLPPATSAAAPDLERWWETFDDPTLSTLIDEALVHNLDLAAAMARVLTQWRDGSARAGYTLC